MTWTQSESVALPSSRSKVSPTGFTLSPKMGFFYIHQCARKTGQQVNNSELKNLYYSSSRMPSCNSQICAHTTISFSSDNFICKKMSEVLIHQLQVQNQQQDSHTDLRNCKTQSARWESEQRKVFTSHTVLRASLTTQKQSH